MRCGSGREYWDCSCAVRESSRMRRGGILWEIGGLEEAK